MIYGHGDDAFRYGDQLKLNFSSNVYAWADLSGLKEHLMQHNFIRIGLPSFRNLRLMPMNLLVRHSIILSPMIGKIS